MNLSRVVTLYALFSMLKITFESKIFLVTDLIFMKHVKEVWSFNIIQDSTASL